jgi:stage IV sporulation protein FB
MPASFKLGWQTRIARVSHVDIYVHWSVFAIGALILFSARREPLPALVGLTAYLAILLIHESGHLMVARRRGYDALSIALYPVFGLARFERPASRFDRGLIAWGGVLAQTSVAVPIVLCVQVFGYTPWEPLNAALAVLGAVSLGTAAFNLLPVRPLDGSVAWDLIPAFFEQRRLRKNRRVVPYRSSR